MLNLYASQHHRIHRVRGFGLSVIVIVIVLIDRKMFAINLKTESNNFGAVHSVLECEY